MYLASTDGNSIEDKSLSGSNESISRFMENAKNTTKN